MEITSSISSKSLFFASPQLFFALTLCIIAILVGVVLNKKCPTTKTPPEPKGALPIIGHLHLLPPKAPLYRTLQHIADQIGPIFTIRLGTKRTLVVSSWEAVKEIFGTHDRIFLTRPKSACAKYMGNNYAMFGLSPYGPYWREMRKFIALHLLSNSRLEQLKPVRCAELATSINHLLSLSRAGRVDMSEWFTRLVMNTTTRMLVGKRYGNLDDPNKDECGRFVKAVEEFFHLMGAVVVSDLVPLTEWLDIGGRVKAMKRVAKELDYFMSAWVEEHVKRRREEKVKSEDSDFMDMMLSAVEEEYGYSSFERPVNDVIIKGTALGLILAGVDTTSATLTWALSLLLNHPEVLHKAQNELDAHVGKERWVEESDTKNLPYLMAIVKETLRMYPAGPLSVPRESLEDCIIAGYHVPKGTRLLVNIWKLHHDPRVWSDPCKFQPERFLTTHAQYDVRGKNIDYIPFSAGRRACPGISSAMLISCLTLARVLQGFNVSTVENQKVDISEGLSITLPKAEPLEVVLTPRLPFELYEL